MAISRQQVVIIRRILANIANSLRESRMRMKRTIYVWSAVMACCLFMAPHHCAFAQVTFTDDAMRTVTLPKKITKTFAAGAPAEVLLYTIAPETMVGRNHLPSTTALEFMPSELRNPTPIAKLPRSQDASNDAELLAL